MRVLIKHIILIIILFYGAQSKILEIKAFSPFWNVKDESQRVDCQPEGHADEEVCQERGCLFSPAHTVGPPWCYFPDDYGYLMEGEPFDVEGGIAVKLKRNPNLAKSMFGKDLSPLYVLFEYQKDERLRIRIAPTLNRTTRFEVPIRIAGDGARAANPMYEIEFVAEPVFSFRVVRRSTGTVVFDTSLGGFTYSEQFLQISTRLPSTSVFGLGEHESVRSRLDLNYAVYGMWNRDQPPSGLANMYGTHPYYTVLEDDGNVHSVLFLNSAGQDVTLMPTPALVYKTIGGILDMYLFFGPGPEQVVSQYTEAIGRYYVPPYWSLGFHLCKYGYKSVSEIEEVVERTAKYGIPHDTQWADIDLMDKAKDFTIGAGFENASSLVKNLHEKGMKFVTILDPCISCGEPAGTYRAFDYGQKLDVWLKNSSGKPLVGRVWPEKPVYFPDFFNDNTKRWWIEEISQFHKILPWDGLWIDMNEPSNFVNGNLDVGCEFNDWNYPPYKPRILGAVMADKTVCNDAVSKGGLHYDTHNLFGWSQTLPTLLGVQKATGKRGLVLSRSTFLASGRWTAHWLGDNFSNWYNLRASIIGMFEFNQFGIPFVGADICGFSGSATAELCARWQQLGAFYPFSRNHNAIGNRDQDPGVFGPIVAKITSEALRMRYALLPYLYTLFYRHRIHGETVARPLWHEFPRDANTRDLDGQFMWGGALLISPVLESGARTKEVYFPDQRWYSLTLNEKTWGREVDDTNRGTTRILDTPLEMLLPLHLRGGYVVPIQKPELTTVASRRNDFMLLVCLDDSGRSKGELFYDDGESIATIESKKYYLANFRAENDSVRIFKVNDGYDEIKNLTYDSLFIMGIKKNVTEVYVNKKIHKPLYFKNGILALLNLKLSTKRKTSIISY